MNCRVCGKVYDNPKSLSNHARHHVAGFTEKWLKSKGSTPRKFTPEQKLHMSRVKRKEIVTNEHTSRQRARYDYGNKPCVVCGEDKSEIHHVDGNPFNNSPENIMHLCRKHHMEADGRVENLKQFSFERGVLA